MRRNFHQFVLRNFLQVRLFQKSINTLTAVAILLLALVNSCTEFAEVEEINAPVQATVDAPVIEGITPASAALGGVREITILGRNFLPIASQDTVRVHVGGAPAAIKSIQNDMITIYRPLLASNRYDTKIFVSVTHPEAISASSNMEYQVESPGGVIVDSTELTSDFVACDLDLNENLFLSQERGISKSDGDGVVITVTYISQLPTIKRVRDAKVGPAVNSKLSLYLATADSSITRLRVDTGYFASNLDAIEISLRPVRIAKFGVPIAKLDFDQSGDIYVYGTGTTGGIFKFKRSDSTYSPNLGYAGLTVTEFRVFNNSLYMSDSTQLLRLPIVGNALGAQEKIVDLSGLPAPLNSCTISSFALDESGNVFLSLKKHPTYSIFVVENSSSITPFYYENILPRNVDRLVWGNGRNLHLIKLPRVGPGGRVFKMVMDRNGAPYYGRQLSQ